MAPERHPYPDFFGTAYPDFPSDPNKCWAKNLFGPCGKRLGRSPHRTQLAQESRFPHNSETGRKAPPPPTRGVQTVTAREGPAPSGRSTRSARRHEGIGAREAEIAKAILPIDFCSHRRHGGFQNEIARISATIPVPLRCPSLFDSRPSSMDEAVRKPASKPISVSPCLLALRVDRPEAARPARAAQNEISPRNNLA